MWLDPKKTFAQGDEDSKLKDRVRRQLPELDTVGEENAPKEFVGRKREAPEEKSHEHNSKSRRRRRTRFVTRDDDVPVDIRNYAGLAQFALITCVES